MNLSNLPTPELLKQIGKDTRSWWFFLMTGLVWFFVFKWSGVTGQMNVNCENEKAALRKEKEALTTQLDSERQRETALILELVRKDQSSAQLDSLLRSKLEVKTKENLQNK